MVNYTKRVVGGVGIAFFMTMLSSLVAYFVRMLLARRLTPAEYGLFYSVFTLVTFFLFFRDLGLNTALVKYIPEFQIKNKFNEIKTAIFSTLLFQSISSLMLGIAFFLLSDFLAKYYFKDPAASLILKLLVLYIIFSVFFIILKNILNGFQKITLFSLSEFFKNAIVFLLLLFFFHMGLGVYSPVWAYVLVCPALFLILLVPTLRSFNISRYRIGNFVLITKKMFLFGMPILITSVGGMIIGYIDTLMLTYFRTLSEVGVYNVILPSAMIILTLSGSIQSVIFPMTSELWAKKDKKRLSEGLRLVHKYAFLATLPLVFTVFTFSGLFIRFFFGSEYVQGAFALQILLVGVLFYIVAGINNNIISAIGKPGTVTKIILLAAVTNALLNIILIPKFGINGAAVATSVSYLLVLILSTHKSTKYIEIGFPSKEWMKVISAAIPFILVISIIKQLLNINPWFELIISTLCASFVYIIFIYFFRIIDVKEIKRYVGLLR